MTYICKNCGEKFRNKSTMNNHKCGKENYLPQDDPEIINGLDFEKLKRNLEAEDE